MLSAELKKIDEDLKALGRGAMFMGTVAQKSLLDVVTEPEKRDEKPVKLTESVAAVELEKPGLKEVCSTCKSFLVHEGSILSSRTVGICERDSMYVLSSAEACEHWKRASSKRASKSTDDVQLLVEAHRNYLKALIA